MINATYLNFSGAKITFHSSTYNPLNAGEYTIVVTYNWGGTGSVTS